MCLTKEMVLILPPPLTPAPGELGFIFFIESARVISAFGKKKIKMN